MRFNKVFKRDKAVAAGNPALGSDGVPTGPKSDAASDNVDSSRINMVAGVIAKRLAVAVGYAGAAAPPNAITFDVYTWDDLTAAWYLIAKDQTATPGSVTLVDLFAVAEQAPRTSTLGASAAGGAGGGAGSTEVMVIPKDAGGSTASNGTYSFAIGFSF